MPTTYELSGPVKLTKYLHLYREIPNHEETSLEEVGTGDDSQTTFWLNRLGVLEGTYTLYYGASSSSVTQLTETTDYSLDLDTSKIVLTSGGVTKVGTNKIFASYAFNLHEILNSEILNVLNAAERKVVDETEQYFADGTSEDPAYRKIVDEGIKGHYNPYDKVYDLYWNPVICIDTTTNGDFTFGETTITLTDATGLPNAATIYIGGNKVSYTARSGNDLTVPDTTPSIDDGSTVRGEVIELSMQPEGTNPDYKVLDPHLDYEIDYIQGKVKILANAYWGEISPEDRLYPSNYLIKASYMNAWRERGRDAFIPDDIQEIVNFFASRKLKERTVNRSHITGTDEFNAAGLSFGMTEMNSRLEYYRPLNVGTSMHDKQHLS